MRTNTLLNIIFQPRLLKEIDNCKEKTQKVEDQLNKVNDDLSKKIEAEQKEVRYSIDEIYSFDMPYFDGAEFQFVSSLFNMSQALNNWEIKRTAENFQASHVYYAIAQLAQAEDTFMYFSSFRMLWF